ncbi:MAG: HAD family hydrolase, partial [Clostridia bacterium]|nr:HAD family hydrolase [Clostridia bacterium]
GMGVKISVLSNKQDNFVKDIIAKLFDRKLFSCIQGQANMPTKPNPTSALAIAKSMGVKPSRCLFIGDSDVDIQTAKNAGMRSVGVSWGYREREVLEEAGADFIAKTPGDICNIINSLKDEIEKKKKQA